MIDQNTPDPAEITPKVEPTAAPSDPASSDPAPLDPDAVLRDRLADAVAIEAAFEGWTRTALAAAGRLLDLPAGEVDRLFPGGPIQVLTHVSELADQRTVRDMEAEGVAAFKIRDRIKAAVRLRLERHAGNREAARRALAVLSLPFNAGLGLKLLYRTVDAMWYAAGDTSTDSITPRVEGISSKRQDSPERSGCVPGGAASTANSPRFIAASSFMFSGGSLFG